MANDTINLKELRTKLRPHGANEDHPKSSAPVVHEPLREAEYHPDDHPAYGMALMTWDAYEFEIDMARSLNMALLGIGLVLAGIIIFFAWTYLFGLFLGIAGGLTLGHAFRAPQTVHCGVTSHGVRMGNRIYEFESLKSFWIDYSPPHACHLIVHSKRALMPYLALPLGDADPLRLRDILIRFLREEQHETTLTDAIGKRLGF